MHAVESGLARPILTEIHPYIPGKPISEVAREFGVGDIVKLASNENPLGPSPRALEAMRAMLPAIHLYPDGGCYSLRCKLAGVYDFPADGIVLGNGSTEIVELICEAYLEPGREAITGPQAFFKYRIGCQIMGVQPVMVPMPGYRYDVKAILKAVNARTRLVFIANPNNPTGTYLSRAEIERLIDGLPPQVILVLDEAYHEFVNLPDYPDGLEYVRAGLPVIVLRTFSKAYGLAGVRCGYALTRPGIAADLHKVREVFNCNCLAQIAATAALDDLDFLRATLDLNRRGLDELATRLPQYGLEVVPSVGNFVLADFHRPLEPVFTALLQRGVIVRPMGPYQLPTCARISVGLPEHHQKLFAALQEIL
ncbi:MAG: histidinol-phosphate transaminase [Candidatus Zixiibacteriota bacterium]|nr:MAG: histidinol-phosphate transaminase [candidate division Zixibacteria bacterium]